MLWLFIIFFAAVWAIAKAPQQITQLALAGFWVILIGGCAASVAPLLVR